MPWFLERKRFEAPFTPPMRITSHIDRDSLILAELREIKALGIGCNGRSRRYLHA